jgi:ATP-dependent protease HslVU (ClpYQ) peptidase subunit
MTTVAVVRKNGIAAIAADTLTKWGSAKESATYIANHQKILQVGENYLGITGTATFKHILADYFSAATEARLRSSAEIFRAWNKLHAVLKERYYVLPEEDKEDALESSRLDVLIANPYGIYGVSGHRTVQEFARFYAYGTGSDYALGALYSAYDDPALDALALARHAIECAAEFDDCTGLPIDAYTVSLLHQ